MKEKQIGLFGGEESLTRRHTSEKPRNRRDSSWRYRTRHRERVNETTRQRVARDRLKTLARKYGTTVEVLLAALGKPCGICGVKQSDVLDHDRQTGKFRGGLCRQCNAALGKLGDNIAGVQRALAYLRKTTIQ